MEITLTQQPRPLPQEIVDWIREDFHSEDHEEAERLLAYSWLEDRCLRCALYLAGGDPDRLRRAVDLGKSDPRDLIVSAEYERPGYRHVRDFSRPRAGGSGAPSKAE